SGSPRLAPVYTDYAYVLNTLKRSKEAEAYAREALASSPEDVRAPPVGRAAPKLELGVSLVLQNRFTEAIPFLEQSERIYGIPPTSDPKRRYARRAQEYL